MGQSLSHLADAYLEAGRIVVTPNGYVRLVFRAHTLNEALALCSLMAGARRTYIKRRKSYDVYVAKQQCLGEALLLLRRAFECAYLSYPHELTLAQAYLDRDRRERPGIAMRLRRYTLRRAAQPV